MTQPTLEAAAELLDLLARMCYATAREKGFHTEHEEIQDLFPDSAVLPDSDYERITRWFESTCEQAEIARMHSELSEWLEGVRKDPRRPDNHLPDFISAEVEAADTIIRILDTCGKRGYRIGEALISKIHFNQQREYKHGKNS